MIPFACAPQVHPDTITAIVRVESGGNPLAIHDNTTRRSVQPLNVAGAVRSLEALLAKGHSVDVGLMQVNSRNFARTGLTPETAFDACANVRAGGLILTQAWYQSTGHHYSGRVALWHAVQVYNSGNLNGAPVYAAAVFRRKVPAGHKEVFSSPGAAFSTAWNP